MNCGKMKTVLIHKLNILNNDIKLDDACWNCSESFGIEVYHKDNWEGGDCLHCKNSQLLLTQVGAQLLLFLKDYTNVSINQE
jgi:hypothetical protein